MSRYNDRARTVPDDVLPLAKALGDKTRFRIFCYIFEAAHPVGVAELTSYMSLNHNAVRQHLEILVSAGLVTGDVEQRGRPGRPRLLYSSKPEVGTLWATPGPYEQLAVWLAQTLRTGEPPEEVGRRAGLDRAARLSRSEAAPAALVVLEAEMARAGFRPLRRERPGTVELVLQECPFESAAAANAAVVCRLHLGLAQGLAQGVGGTEVQDLVVKNPRKAGCRLVLKET
jgi:predicted ArsR family transcriptional regulator